MNLHHFNSPINSSGSGEPAELISLIDQKKIPDLFIINLNYSHKNIHRTDNAGIMLLKHLRLCGYRQHCVIYSFLSREQLMEMDWRNLIIFSEGVTFLRMPHDLKALDYDELSKEKAPEDLSAFFKAEFQLPDNRHFFANWWGIWRLWQVHKLLLNENDTDTLESSILEHARKEMMTYQGLMAQYIYGINQEEIKKSLNAISMQMKQDRLNDLENEQTSVSVKLREVENALEQKEDITEVSKGSTSGNWMAALKMAFRALTGRRKHERPVENPRQMLEKEKMEYAAKLQQLDEKITLLNNELNEKPNTEPDDQRPTDTNELSQVLKQLRTKVSKKTPTILYIDDQANEGWQQIFTHILFGEETDQFAVYQPLDQKPDTIINHTLKLIREKKPDLIMLDLRPCPEDEHIKDVSEISGVKVLNSLKKAFASILCPVMVVSASNKLWSYQNVLASGADAYWMKEGLDNRLDAEGSSENYAALLKKLDALLFSEGYARIRNIGKIIRKLDMEKSPYWWESMDWIHKMSVYKVNPIEKGTVQEILAESIELMKDKLAKDLFIGMQPELSNDYRASVAVKLFSVVEKIHKTTEEDSEGYIQKISLSHKISNQLTGSDWGQLPQQFTRLISHRNKAAHQQCLEADEFKVFLENLALYLTSPPFGIRTVSMSDNIEDEIILEECVSNINKIGRREISVYRPKEMPDCIKCLIKIQKSFINPQDVNNIQEGTKLKYKLTLTKKGNSWVGLPSEVEVL